MARGRTPCTTGRMQIYTPTGGSVYKLKAETGSMSYSIGLHTNTLATPLAVAAGDCIGWTYSGSGFLDWDSGGNNVRMACCRQGVGSNVNFDNAYTRTYSYEITKAATCGMCGGGAAHAWSGSCGAGARLLAAKASLKVAQIGPLARAAGRPSSRVDTCRYAPDG